MKKNVNLSYWKLKKVLCGWRMNEYPGLEYLRPMEDRNMHVSQVRRRESICHYHSGQLDTIPSCSKIHKIFYRICFSIADGLLHMFSSHWSRVPGWQCCSSASATYKAALCLNFHHTYTLKRREKRDTQGRWSLHECFKPSVTRGCICR